MNELQIVKNAVKAIFGTVKVPFSRSARKGSLSLDVFKCEGNAVNEESIVKTLENLKELGIEGWERFSSRDGGTVGIKKMNKLNEEPKVEVSEETEITA